MIDRDPTRAAALSLLEAVLDRRRPLDEALDALPVLEARDRAAAHRLAAMVLRRLGSVDSVLEPFLRRDPPIRVRHILRLGTAGLLLADTPAHAAVATAVALARAQGLGAFTGLVNAVLRRIAEAGTAVLADIDAPRADTPAWLWASWGDDARAIAEAHHDEAPLDLSVKPGADPPPGGLALPTGSWRYWTGTRVPDLPGYAEGAFWVQDAAARLPALLLDAQAGQRVADLCAAPGGKTAQVASTGAVVTAVEKDGARLERLRQNMHRLKLTAETVLADAETWRPPAPLDAVLLDAPCSATGTIRRHPDILHVKRALDLPPLVAQQDRLLDAACEMVRPGGRLVYAVCSLQPEEGIERVRAAVRRNPLTVEPVALDELPSLERARTMDGFVRITPAFWREQGGLDGFFIARFRRY